MTLKIFPRVSSSQLNRLSFGGACAFFLGGVPAATAEGSAGLLGDCVYVSPWEGAAAALACGLGEGVIGVEGPDELAELDVEAD